MLKWHSSADWPIAYSRSITSLIYHIFAYKVLTPYFHLKGLEIWCFILTLGNSEVKDVLSCSLLMVAGAYRVVTSFTQVELTHNRLKQIYKSDNFSQKCHLNWQSQHHLYIIHHIHPNTHYMIVDESTPLNTKFWCLPWRPCWTYFFLFII